MSLIVRKWTATAGVALLAMAAAPAAQESREISVIPGGPAGPPQIGGGPNSAPMPVGTGTILGRVIESGTSRPVPGAIVVLSLPPAGSVRVMANAQGQFAFRNVPAGRLSLTASRLGYVDGAYGRQRPGGPAQPLELAADAHASDVVIPLWKFGAITGRVTDESGDPIVGTNVRVLKRTFVGGKRQFAMGQVAATDDRGVYRISSLEPGEYLVVVPMARPMSPEALMRSLGTRDTPPPPPPPPGGAGGNAFFVTRVNVNGGDMVVVSSSDSGAPYAGTTSDGLPLTYASEFYPSASTSGRAQPVTVASGDERGGIDFQLKPVRAVNVSGTVIAPGGEFAGGPTVTLIPAGAEDLLTPIEIATTQAFTDGTFQFTDIPSGQYMLRAQSMPRMAPGPGETVTMQSGGGDVRMVTRSVMGPGFPAPPLPASPMFWAEVGLTVAGEDIIGLAVPLRNGLRVSGRVEFSGSAPQPTADQMSSISISLEPADGRTGALGSTARGRVESDRQFTTMGVPAGKYLLRAGAPGQWALRGAVVNGQDISDVPIELEQNDVAGVVITFTDRPASVRGNVTGVTGQPDGGAAVLLFPSDRGAWTDTGSAPRRMRNVRTRPDGSYSFANVPAGDYFVVAVSDAATTDWPSADLLATLSRAATRISVQEGDSKTQALTTRGQ